MACLDGNIKISDTWPLKSIKPSDVSESFRTAPIMPTALYHHNRNAYKETIFYTVLH